MYMQNLYSVSIFSEVLKKVIVTNKQQMPSLI